MEESSQTSRGPFDLMEAYLQFPPRLAPLRGLDIWALNGPEQSNAAQQVERLANVTQIPSVREGNGQGVKRKREEDPLQERLARLESRLEGMQRDSQWKIEQLSNQILELQKDGHVNISKEKKLKRKNLDLKEQLARKDQEIEELDEILEEQQDIIYDYQGTIEDLDVTLEEQQEVIADYQQIIEDLDAEVEDLQHV